MSWTLTRVLAWRVSCWASNPPNPRSVHSSPELFQLVGQVNNITQMWIIISGVAVSAWLRHLDYVNEESVLVLPAEHPPKGGGRREGSKDSGILYREILLVQDMALVQYSNSSKKQRFQIQEQWKETKKICLHRVHPSVHLFVRRCCRISQHWKNFSHLRCSSNCNVFSRTPWALPASQD